MISRAILGSRDLILKTKELQRMALFFDQILIYDLSFGSILEEDKLFYQSELDFLRENEVVRSIGADARGMHKIFLSGGKEFDVDRDRKSVV